MELKAGQRIIAPFLPAPAEVKKFEPRGGYFLLEVVLDDGHHTYKPLRITEDQLAQIQILGRSPVALTEDAEDFFFLIEAHRIRLAYQFDPQLAVSISQVDPLPHQIEAVYRYALESPRIRFLIADDPGAGKTIMAGLILKELQYRRLARRVLIVAPALAAPEPELTQVKEGRAPYAIEPDSVGGAGMRRDEEIEAAGMRVALDYEREQGWRPEDVSGENHGFDVRSTRYDSDGTFADIRYIEVKARAGSGAIRLSANEWKKARRFSPDGDLQGRQVLAVYCDQSGQRFTTIAPHSEPGGSFPYG